MVQVPVPDSYYGLVNKTAMALRWAVSSSWSFVMVLDDDVYVVADEVRRALQASAPRQRFYAGQVGEAPVEAAAAAATDITPQMSRLAQP